MDPNLRIFIVKFGKMESGWYPEKTLHVVAKNFSEAARKALIEFSSEIEDSVLTSDGSLKTKENELFVKSVELASNKLVM